MFVIVWAVVEVWFIIKLIPPKEHTPAPIIDLHPQAKQATLSIANPDNPTATISRAQPSLGPQDTPFPDLQDLPDDSWCAIFHRQCTEEEVNESLSYVRLQWNWLPEELRTKCVSNETINAMEKCILTETVSWFGTHPNAKAPWLDFNGEVSAGLPPVSPERRQRIAKQHVIDEQGLKQRAAERQKAEIERREANSIAVTARALSGAPGAIICPNFDTVGLLFSQYNRHWEETFQDKLSHGQSKLIQGEPAPAPDPEEFGCVLVAPGTSMMLERGNIVPVVTVTEPDGSLFRGVTLGGMISKPK